MTLYHRLLIYGHFDMMVLIISLWAGLELHKLNVIELIWARPPSPKVNRRSTYCTQTNKGRRMLRGLSQTLPGRRPGPGKGDDGIIPTQYSLTV